jgi:hypothetical protein
MFPGSEYFVGGFDLNITHEIHLNTKDLVDDQGSLISPQLGFAMAILVLAAAIVGVIWYKRVQERKRVELLRGILTDTMMELQVANEYIAVIFDCYKKLVQFFRRHGFMKKVYETTREFESAVGAAFNMVPAAQLEAFLAIFEEARYSDHVIGVEHRDHAIQTLDAITRSIGMALGAEGMITRTEEHESKLYAEIVKAGSFIDADGNERQAGIVEGENQTSI